MVHIESKTGIEADVGLDFDKIVAYEQAHPDWSLMTEMQSLGEKMRFSTIDLLASFIYPGGWKGWVADGFTIKDMTLVITEGLKELGFTPEDGPSAE